MKTFEEYLNYIDERIKPLSINNESDLINFTKLLNNYGKVAIKFYYEDVEKIINKHKLRGFLEFDLIEPMEKIEIMDSMISFTIGKKKYEYPFVSPVHTLKKDNNRAEMFLIISLLLDNKRQSLFQLFHKAK